MVRFSNRLASVRLAALVCCLMEVGVARDSSWEDGVGFRSRPLPVPKDGRDGFHRVPGAVSGVQYTNVLTVEGGLRTQLNTNGSGVAAGDVDGDGWCDLFFGGMESEARLYRNRGEWRFEDVTAAAGLEGIGLYSTGAVFADVDGDGDLDLLVNAIGGGTRLFINDGQGHFQEVLNRGLVRKYGAMSMALADVDGNGTLDLYVENYNSPTVLADQPNTRFTIQPVDGKPTVVAVNGRPVAGTELAGRYGVSPFDNAIREFGQPDILYLNDGAGRFTALSWTDGRFLDPEGKPLTAPPRDLGLSVMFRDMNDDGAPDLYVCNDLFTPDRIWINHGRGQFRALSTTAVRSSSVFSMGLDFADIDRDGDDDFLVLDMLSRDHRRRTVQAHHMTPVVVRSGEKHERTQVKRNVLQLNRGDGTYADIAQMCGLEASEWTWAVVFLDVDLDGFEDVLFAAGYDRDSMNGDVAMEIRRRQATARLSSDEIRRLGLLYPPVPSPLLSFRNQGNLRFAEMGREWGFNWVGVNQGICYADLDNDGDLEVIVNALHGEAGLYRNESVKPRVAVRLKGLGGNTRGIGSKIWLYGGAVPMQSQEMMCGGRYLSCDDAVRVFAAGPHDRPMRIVVRWRSGQTSVVERVQANREYEIDEAGAAGHWEEQKPKEKPLFEDVSDLLKHKHFEPPYDDFGRQPLLPKKLSQLGPGVSWTDLDEDGRDDLLVSSGRGGQLEIFLNQGQGQFLRLPTGVLLGRAEDDQTTVLGDGLGGILVGQANYETGGTNGVRRYEMWAGGIDVREVLSTGGVSSVGPMAMGDLDGDGNLELFVGGRVNAGRWPEPADSRIYRKQDGTYVLDTENTRTLQRIGMVSGAVWSDLDGDGYPELILACEWGPLAVFHNDHGHLKRWNPPVSFAAAASGGGGSTLDQLTGWWNGVVVGDFDGDGRMDIVGSNWGSNSKYQRGRSLGQPLRVYFGDWAEDSVIEVLEAYYDPVMGKIVPWRGLNGVALGMPWIRGRFATHAAYGEAGVEEILGERMKQATVLEAGWLESTVFLNRGGRFEAVVLPGEAQFAPAFGVSVGDMDGDGKEDIFLSQNFYGVDSETSPYDAGRAVWLRGDGHGGFEPAPGHVSGVAVYGEGRGSALCDYDGDGRVDLVAAQNGGETRLFHNVRAKPGLRVKLAGPEGNPTGVGAAVRLRFRDQWGPAREVHAGSGYWSQDSAEQVMATPETPTAIWVRWPGGKMTGGSLVAPTAMVTASFDGKVSIR